MKNLNIMKFMYNASTQFNEWIAAIESATDYEKAKEKAIAAIGFVDCLNTFNNTMVSSENNDFTADTDDLLNEMCRKVYSTLISKAADTKQDAEVILSLCKKREMYQGN